MRPVEISRWLRQDPAALADRQVFPAGGWKSRLRVEAGVVQSRVFAARHTENEGLGPEGGRPETRGRRRRPAHSHAQRVAVGCPYLETWEPVYYRTAG